MWARAFADDGGHADDRVTRVVRLELNRRARIVREPGAEEVGRCGERERQPRRNVEVGDELRSRVRAIVSVRSCDRRTSRCPRSVRIVVNRGPSGQSSKLITTGRALPPPVPPRPAIPAPPPPPPVVPPPPPPSSHRPHRRPSYPHQRRPRLRPFRRAFLRSPRPRPSRSRRRARRLRRRHPNFPPHRSSPRTQRRLRYLRPRRRPSFLRPPRSRRRPSCPRTR